MIHDNDIRIPVFWNNQCHIIFQSIFKKGKLIHNKRVLDRNDLNSQRKHQNISDHFSARTWSITMPKNNNRCVRWKIMLHVWCSHLIAVLHYQTRKVIMVSQLLRYNHNAFNSRNNWTKIMATGTASIVASDSESVLAGSSKVYILATILAIFQPKWTQP